MSFGAKGNKMPYVYTNPHKDTELFTCDRVFVLSPKILITKVSHFSSAADLTLLQEMPSNSKVAPKKRSQSEDFLTLDVKTETPDLTETHKKIESKVAQQAAILTHRVDQILDRVTKLKGQMVKRPLPS